MQVNKKSIVEKVKNLSKEERVAKVLSLSLQSDWTNWDDLIQQDFGWNELMYGFSPSLLSFWLNSIQNTLPDPTNLRRWGKQQSASCTLCKWKNCTLQQILCSCPKGLEQGRISWRHDSILAVITKYLKESLIAKKDTAEDIGDKIRFVKKGVKPTKQKRKKTTYWGTADDWKILMDTRRVQYQVPPAIASTSQRPDICVYSLKAKKVCFIELTSPAEENVKLWKIKKRVKYIDLVEEAKSNGFKACCRTIEVGARGFLSDTSLGLFSMFGFTQKDIKKIGRHLSKTAIRCSHFIWINRENEAWGQPARIV